MKVIEIVVLFIVLALSQCGTHEGLFSGVAKHVKPKYIVKAFKTTKTFVQYGLAGPR